MNLFFDEDSQKLIINAKKEMYQLNHPYVGSEHLLLAILNNTDLEVTKILNSYGINYANFKEELVSVVGIGSKGNNWFLFTPLLKRIINNATYYSKEKEKVVTPYHLLVSILQEGDGVANRILMSMNIDLNMLYDKFLSTNIVSKNKTTPILDELGINMNKASLEGKYDPVIGRDLQINQVIEVLLRKNKNNPLLIGEAGVGKTAIVEELARKITLGDVPYKLKGKIIYSISMSSLVAGTKYRGEFEEKLNNLISEVINSKNIILFIDEIHTLMGAGGAEGAIDASNILKPYLARGDIHLIGATTMDEYNKYIINDKAMDRRFKTIIVSEADNEMIKNILLELKPIYEKYHNVEIGRKELFKILEISNTCVFTGKQPDKAIDLLDEVCSYVLLHKNGFNNMFIKYERDIKELETKKNREIIKHNFKDALMYKDKEMKLRSEYNNKLFSNNIVSSIKISIEDVYSVIYDKYQIPLNINVGELKNLSNQDKIIEKLVNSLKKYDFIKNTHPLIYRFVCKSGIGKTFLIDKIVKNIYSKQNYIYINMNDYNSESSLSKLIGNTHLYGEYDNKCIINSIKSHPFSIIVLDNMNNEKSYVSRFLLDSFDKGYIINSCNDKINLTKCIIFIISTRNSNIGFINIDSVSNNTYVFDDIIFNK